MEREKVEVESNSPCPPPQYGTAVFFSDNCFYTIGGTDGYNYTCDVSKLDLNTNQWEIVQSKPEIYENEPEGKIVQE